MQQCGLFDVLNQLKSLKELVLSAVISSTGAHPNAETKSNLSMQIFQVVLLTSLII